MRKVEVVPYDSKWREAFEVESKLVTDALGENVIAIHHIGSTAIPGIYAKPIIDLLVEVKDIVKVDGQTLSMELLSYEVMGEYGIPGRRYFRKSSQEGVRTHHVHTFKVGSEHVECHLAFRDYMIARPEDAQSYSELKRGLAREHSTNIDRYVNGKEEFVKEMNQKAVQWRTLQMGQPPAT